MGSIAENLEKIRERIADAAEKSGRSFEDIKLIAVTKLHPAEAVDEAALAGVKDVGENKVQELTAKQPLVKAYVNWHLIGHLQSNKVKQVIGKVLLIHSVDSFKLAEEIDRRSEKAGVTSDILIQVNAAGEKQKSGTAPELVEALIKEISERLPHVRVKGLMQIAPFAEDPEDVRKYFKAVAELYDRMASKDLPGTAFETLSMGMSGDFRVAIEEGANTVRIGSAIFGARNYQNS